MDYLRKIASRSNILGLKDGQTLALPAVFSEEISHQIAHDQEQIDEEEVEEEIQEEHEKTRSFVAETTKWEKMRQAGQKLAESALTTGTIKSYEG